VIVSRTRLASRLPAELTSFVGRRRELTEARRLLSAGRLLTVTGVGGVGKTRLALRVADQVRRAFPDGVCLVELAAVHDPALLPQTVSRQLGLRDASTEPTARFAEYLEDKRLLLVLDNCEHLVEACAMLAGKLLAAAPGLRILATSRHVLGVEGEQILSITPLPVPEINNATGTPSGVVRSDAVTLMVDRAAAVVPGFALDDSNRDHVVRICQRLDGIPLAIELAAVRLRALSPGEILDRLDDCFHLLTAGSRTAPSRQQTLQAAIDWSHDLCSPEEQLLWRRLSVFSGGFDLGAAEDVGSDGSVASQDVLGIVAGLVDKSIVVRLADDQGRWARYRMLEIIRRYGLVRLVSSGDEPAVRGRHLEHYRQLSRRYRAESFGEHQLEWIERLVREHGNVRVALEHGLTHPEQTRATMEMAAALWNFWFSGGLLREGHGWLERALAADLEPSRVRADALWTCAFLGVQLGESDTAQVMLTECAALADRFGDAALRAHVDECSGLAALFRGEVPQARALLEDAVAGHRSVGDLLGVADSLILLAAATFFMDDPRGADAAAECLQLCEKHHATWTKGYALWAVAIHKWSSGQHREGARLIQTSIRLQRTVRDWTGLAYYLEVLAWCTSSAGEPERAAHLLGAATAVWQLSGAKAFEAPPYQAFDERVAEQSRQALGTEAFDAALAAGKGLTLDQVFTYVLGDKQEGPSTAEGTSQRRQGSGTGLTRRELEIAELVAEGLTNKEIASRLTIARRTAEGHVENILAKFGFTSRAQIAAWVAERRASN
jgi:predicted ATPase/DNA-binding CsgD family transcriptional regulator